MQKSASGRKTQASFWVKGGISWWIDTYIGKKCRTCLPPLSPVLHSCWTSAWHQFRPSWCSEYINLLTRTQSSTKLSIHTYFPPSEKTRNAWVLLFPPSPTSAANQPNAIIEIGFCASQFAFISFLGLAMHITKNWGFSTKRRVAQELYQRNPDFRSIILIL